LHGDGCFVPARLIEAILHVLSSELYGIVIDFMCFMSCFERSPGAATIKQSKNAK
jgi:hypothetical protein